MPQPSRWSFAGFDLDADAGVLTKHGVPVRIGRQAFRALALLVARGGQVVTRDDLQQEIWGDRVHVDFEHGLNVCIRQVRTALADEADSHQIIVTCPREGYRLGVAVTRVHEVHPVHEVSDMRRPSLPRWAVAAASVVLALAGYLLAFQVGSSTSRSVGPASDVSRRAEAHEWYWRGRAYADRASGRDSFAALRYFERAAALDASFAPAQAALAVSYLDRAAAGITPADSAIKARHAAARAVGLAPQSAEPHVALAELRYRLEDETADAEREFARAVQLDGRNVYVRQRYAAFLQEQEQFDAALEQLRLAEELDALSIVTSSQKADTLWLAGRWDESLAQANHTLELDPAHSWSFRTVGRSLEALGRRDEAIVAYLKAGSVALGNLGQAYALAGRRDEARQLLTVLTQHTDGDPGHKGVAIAYIYAGLGETGAAMEWLERARQAGRRLPVTLRVAPQWQPLRASSAFNAFLNRNHVGSGNPKT